MGAEDDLHPVGIVATGHVVSVSARDVHGSVRQLLEAFAGDVCRLGDPNSRHVEVQPHAFHRGCPGHAEHEFEDVHVVVAQFEPQSLGEFRPNAFTPP